MHDTSDSSLEDYWVVKKETHRSSSSLSEPKSSSRCARAALSRARKAQPLVHVCWGGVVGLGGGQAEVIWGMGGLE